MQKNKPMIVRFVIPVDFNLRCDQITKSNLGCNIGYFDSFLPKWDNIDNKEGEHFGIFRLHLDVGMRFHF